MTDLYRFDSVDSPDFGPRTVWARDGENAKWLAVDWHGGVEPSASRLYRAEAIMGDDVAAFEVSDAVPGGSGDAEGLVASAARTAPRGCRWRQIEDGGRSWYGAMLYLGDEPVPARPAPSQD